MAEKRAMIHAVNAVILADGHVHEGEINALTQHMHHIDFDNNFIIQAWNIDSEQGILILRKMPQEKKDNLESILEMTTISDGFKHTSKID